MSENVTKTKEQDGRKPGEDYRDADGKGKRQMNKEKVLAYLA